jgi:hypothetical protein
LPVAGEIAVAVRGRDCRWIGENADTSGDTGRDRPNIDNLPADDIQAKLAEHVKHNAELANVSAAEIANRQADVRECFSKLEPCNYGAKPIGKYWASNKDNLRAGGTNITCGRVVASQLKSPSASS